MSAPVDSAHRSPTAERKDLPRCSVTRYSAGVGMRPDRPPSGSFELAAHRDPPDPVAAQPSPLRSFNGSRRDERGHNQFPSPAAHSVPRPSASQWDGVSVFSRGRSPGPRGPTAPQEARDFRPPAPRARSPEARYGSMPPAEASPPDRANGTRSPYLRGRSPGPRGVVEHPGSTGGNRPMSERDNDDDDAWRRRRGEVRGGGGGPAANACSMASASDSDTSGSGEGRRGREYANLADVPRARRIGHRDTFVAEKRRLEHKLRTRSPGRDEVERLFGKDRRSLGQNQGSPHDREIDRSMSSDADERVDASFHSPVIREPPRQQAADAKVMGGPPTSSRGPHPGHGSFRRSQSLDRQNAGQAPTTDLASTKKGWLTWLDDDNQWRKYWFVLTPGALKFYRDTPSEEKDHAEGVLELSPHCEISDFQVQRNYGFQIKTKHAVHTLYAVTTGIRKSWMEAIGRSMGLGGAAQEKMSSPEKSWPGRSLETSSPSSRDRPVRSTTVKTRDSSPEQTRSRPKARLREVRAKTMDCSEFQAVHQALVRSQRGGGGAGVYHPTMSSGRGDTVRPSTLIPARIDQSRRSEDAGGGHGGATYKTYFQSSHAAVLTGSHVGQDAPHNNTVAASSRLSPRLAASSVRAAEPESRSVSERVALPQDQKHPPPHVHSTLTRDPGGVCVTGFTRSPLGPSDGKPRVVVATSRSQASLPPDKQGPDPSQNVAEKSRGAVNEVHAPGGRRTGREGDGPTVARPPLSRDEIEQQWRQVEKTPVREEKQIPIATIKPTASSMSPEGMVELLQKEVEELRRQLDAMHQDLRCSRGDNSALLARLRALEQAEYPPAGFVSQAMCERGLAAMEESHQRSMEDLQRKHQHDMQLLRKQSEQLLAEETAATIAALEAMKSAHREEFERELEKALKSWHGPGSQDTELIRRQHEEELASIQRELGVLSEQYSQKCLENSHLSQALDAERQALQQCQRENEELNTRCQELNKRLATELMRIRGIATGDSNGAVPSLAPGKDTYELEVMLRVKDSEIQYFKQEINALKEDLQSALRDKKYATDKYKDIYTELSISRAKADLDVTRLREQLQTISRGEEERAGYDILKSKSNPDFFKTQTNSGCKRTVRNLRSKSLKEGLSTQEQKQLFDETEVQQ